ncbi:metal-sensitive transcriptional regulator [Alteribacter natronophilus]|uniref:metal-sensitive transcriptional regulator n=1 Tax=Alteribacter natronophilus TaxID=2583810 RepID=UPI001FEAAF90|nr:metal-sensitive transcriptional regulator [Alteribacter natronophilus]
MVKRMIDQEVYCDDILNQMSAVQSALNRHHFHPEQTSEGTFSSSADLEKWSSFKSCWGENNSAVKDKKPWGVKPMAFLVIPD